MPKKALTIANLNSIMEGKNNKKKSKVSPISSNTEGMSAHTSLSIKNKISDSEFRKVESFLEKLSNNILESHNKESKDRKEFQEFAAILHNILSEFLASYVVVGYDFKNNPVSIQHASNQKEVDAIFTALGRFLSHYQQNNL